MGTGRPEATASSLTFYQPIHRYWLRKRQEFPYCPYWRQSTMGSYNISATKHRRGDLHSDSRYQILSELQTPNAFNLHWLIKDPIKIFKSQPLLRSQWKKKKRTQKAKKEGAKETVNTCVQLCNNERNSSCSFPKWLPEEPQGTYPTHSRTNLRTNPNRWLVDYSQNCPVLLGIGSYLITTRFIQLQNRFSFARPLLSVYRNGVEREWNRAKDWSGHSLEGEEMSRERWIRIAEKPIIPRGGPV